MLIVSLEDPFILVVLPFIFSFEELCASVAGGVVDDGFTRNLLILFKKKKTKINSNNK